MKDYIRHFLHTLSPTNLVGLWPGAVLIAIAAFVFGFGKLIDLLQGNNVGFWGDTAIVTITFLGVTLLAWAKLIFYYCLWSLIGLVLIAGTLAMASLPWFVVIPFVIFVGYGTIRNPLPQKSFSPKALFISTLWRIRQERGFPVTKISSHSKVPYLLFPVSCILLN